jgi:Mycotoxin biosynthesis protein UstYa
MGGPSGMYVLGNWYISHFARVLIRTCSDNNLRVQKGDLEKANITSVPLNDDQGGYLATLDVFHTLHCVNKIRKSYYSDYYHDPNPLTDQQEHFDHCIDLLRQVIMCHGDLALHTYEWKDDYRWPWPSMQTEHQCRNWDQLMAWSKEHHVPSLQGPILSHPTLGKSVDRRHFLQDDRT